MATRMRQRRGTASQWTSANPILGSGEIGWESDTNKLKIGDGINHWADLAYFVDQDSISTSLGDYVETSILEQPNGVATLDSNSKLKTSQLPDVALVTVHAVANQAARLALSVQPGDIAIQADNGQTYVLSASPASTNANWTAITVSDPFPTKDTDDLAEGSTRLYFTNQRALDATSAAYDTAGSASTAQSNAETFATNAINALDTDDIEEGTTNKYFTNQRALDATSTAYEISGSISTHNSDTTNVHGITDTSKLVKTDSLSTTLDGDLVVDGDFTVNGTNFSASATSIVIEDNLVQLAHQNSANTVDLGIVVGYNDGTAKHAGIVRDVSSDKWKLFKGVTTEPATTVDFTQGSLDDLEVAGLVASSASIGDVSNTELQHLNGVTSAIQTQLDGKVDESLFDAKGDLLVGSADNTPAKLSVGTDGYLLTANSGAENGVSWSPAPVSLPSQTGNEGKYLTTNGTSASWGTLVVPITTGTTTINTNTATTIDTNPLSDFTSIEYMISLKQGSKVRTSKLIVQTDGTSVDSSEFGITETGGLMSGIVVTASVSSTNCVVQVTVTDAETTNVAVKFSEVKL